MVQKAFLKIRIGEHSSREPLHHLELVLYDEDVPKTVRNFVHYLSERNASKNAYKNSFFHRIIKGFMAQGGDFLNGDGTGSASIYGNSFPDENFIHRHDRPGILSMANSGKDTNGSQFFLTFRPTPHLDNKHVVFGHVDLSKQSGRDAMRAVENVRVGRNDRPVAPVEIVDCGIITDETTDQNETTAPAAKAGYEQPVAEEEEEDDDDENEVELPEDDYNEEDEEPPKTKAEALRQRMRKLKMKMNQARQLNKREVLREGERLGSAEGASKARKRQQLRDKKARELEFRARNSRALELAESAGLDGKHLVEQADASLKKAYKREQNAVSQRFGVNDYYNPEGMHRNYERNLRGLNRAARPLPDSAAADNTRTFDPILDESDEQRERAGARNLANELKRRIEKQKEKRDRLEFEGEDVTWINQRNKRFNQKISRNFDQHTAEIRQNLERGTAL